MTKDLFSLYHGVLIGTAIGDSLGLPAEGLSGKTIKRRWNGKWRQRLLFSYGMLSDDTEHAVWITRSLMENPHNVEQFQRRLASRFRWWLAGLPICIGKATLIALVKLCLGIKPGKNGFYSAGNAPSMRCAIIGAFFCDDEENLRKYVHASTTLTHLDPKAETAALAVALTAAKEAKAEIRQKEERTTMLSLWKSLAPNDSEWQYLVQEISSGWEKEKGVEEFARSLQFERNGKTIHPVIKHKGITGYSYCTVPVALYTWGLHWGDFRTGMGELLNCGGDTDTVGAIYGALAGINNPLPEEWVSHLKDYPVSVSFLERQARNLAKAREENRAVKPDFFPWFAVPVRNFLFFLIVMGHCLRRIVPF